MTHQTGQAVLKSVASREFDVQRIRQDFPILSLRPYGKPLVYLDNAATTQKPKSVLKRLDQVYSEEYSNVHRAVHWLSERATEAYEEVRKKVRDFIVAKSEREIIFVKGTTDAINLVAASFGKKYFRAGDEVIISALEHHSNIVPWQMVCETTGARLRVVPISKKGEILIDEYKKILSSRTKLVAIAHVSNALGTINPIKEIIHLAHQQGASVLIDGAQAAPHMKINVQEIECDFYAFSAHKAYGPTGAGVLYGREELLQAMPPYQGGGDMIRSVTFEKTTYNEIPYKFEAGTPNIADVIGFGTALDYLRALPWKEVQGYEQELLEYATGRLSQVPDLEIIGTAENKTSVISFTLKGIHPHDIGTILDREGIAVRAGHHCAQPVMDFYGVPATVRVSLAFYNTKEEIDRLIEGIYKVKKMFE